MTTMDIIVEIFMLFARISALMTVIVLVPALMSLAVEMYKARHAGK